MTWLSLLNSCHCLSVVYDFKSAPSNLYDEWTFCAEYHVCHFRLLECPYQVLHDGRPFKSVDKGEITTKKIVDCLRTKPMEQMMNTHPNFYEWKHLEQSQVIFPLSSKYLDFSKWLQFFSGTYDCLVTPGWRPIYPTRTGRCHERGQLPAHSMDGNAVNDIPLILILKFLMCDVNRSDWLTTRELTKPPLSSLTTKPWKSSTQTLKNWGRWHSGSTMVRPKLLRYKPSR